MLLLNSLDRTIVEKVEEKFAGLLDIWNKCHGNWVLLKLDSFSPLVTYFWINLNSMPF